MFVVDGR